MLKLRYIDALRGLAILAVIITHASQFGTNTFLPAILVHAISRGINGVQLFFFVSAFTLFLSVNTRYGKEKYFTGNFFIRRFFRIAPMYYLAIVYYLWQDGFGPRFWLGDAFGVTIGNITGNVFFVHGFNAYWINSLVPGGWSIAVEMLFYLILPFLFYKIKNTQQATVFFLLTLILRFVLDILLRRFHFMQNDMLWYNYLYFYLPSQLPVFALGILFYFIIKDNYQPKIKPYTILIAALFLLIQYLGVVLLPDHVFCTIAFFVLALALSRHEYKIVVNHFTTYLGKISFSMYLSHFAVLHWLTRFHLIDYLPVHNSSSAVANYIIRLIIVLSASMLISTFLYHFIELPAQKIGYRLIKKREEDSQLA